MRDGLTFRNVLRIPATLRKIIIIVTRFVQFARIKEVQELLFPEFISFVVITL